MCDQSLQEYKHGTGGSLSHSHILSNISAAFNYLNMLNEQWVTSKIAHYNMGGFAQFKVRVFINVSSDSALCEWRRHLSSPLVVCVPIILPSN